MYTDRSIFNFPNTDESFQGGALLIVDFKYRFDEGRSPESRKKHNVEKYYEDLFAPPKNSYLAEKGYETRYIDNLCRCLKSKLPYSWTTGVTVTDRWEKGATDLEKDMKKYDVLSLNFSIAENILVEYPDPDNKKLSLVFQDAQRVLNNYRYDSQTVGTTFKTLIKSEDLSKFKEIYPNKVTEE